MMNKYGILFLLLLILSCGRSPQDDSGRLGDEEIDTEGIYSATLFPVNPGLVNNVMGQVKITSYGDEFKVSVDIKNASSGIHKQQLHTGSACPNSNADENRDGLIDSYEALKIMGLIIVPFNGDLSSQDLGSTFHPTGSNYLYERSTSYQLMLADLHQVDPMANDSLVKLKERHLPLEMRAVSVYGSSPIGEVPIACGILARISNNPEDDMWEDSIPSQPRPVPRTPPPAEAEGNPPDPTPDVEEGGIRGRWERMRQRWRNWIERVSERRN